MGTSVCNVNGRDSSVGIGTRYGLDGPAIESRLVGDSFCTRPDRPWTGSLPGVKRPGKDVDNRSPSSAEVKERLELYLYSTSGPSWLILG